MEILQIEEFSTFENIQKFIRGVNVNMPNFIAKYFDEEPTYKKAFDDIGGTVLTFDNSPLEIVISGQAELSVFLDFRLESTKKISILGFVDQYSKASDITERLGPPDFEINEEKRIKLKHNAKIIKYFIDNEYSISFDYNESIEMASIFKDKYR